MMGRGIGYKILENLLIIEVVIIILIVIMTYGVILFSSYFRNKREKNKRDIENYFKKLINDKAIFDFKSFPKRWKKISLLTTLVTEFDKIYQSNAVWENIKSELVTHILLPLARIKTSRPRWISRFFASEIFGFSSDAQDEPYIVKLCQDKVPLVYLHAIIAAIQSRSEKAINICITRLSNVYWISQLIYLQFFKEADQSVIQIVEKRLQTESDPLVKVTCYKILINHDSPATLKKAEEDIVSENFELRLAALKFIVAVKQEHAMSLLSEKLKDAHWEVRLVALHRLGMMKNISTAMSSIVDCLQDDNWWVKISAAEILKNLGEEGKNILKEKAPELQSVTRDNTAHITHTLW